MTMAFVEGHSLADHLARAGPLPAARAAAVVRQLALALAEAHRRGIIHRDLKPANVMLNWRQEPVIMDFGLARRAQADDPRLSQHGALIGTPAYMAPEQVTGEADAAGPACDVYGLGVIFYELLTGRRPFDGPVLAVLGQVLSREPEPPSKHCPGLDPALEAICLRALAKRPGDRQPSMDALAADLARWLRSATATGTTSVALGSPPPVLPGPAGATVALRAWPALFRQVRSRRRVAALALAGIIAALVVGLTAVTWHRPGRTTEPPGPGAEPAAAAPAGPGAGAPRGADDEADAPWLADVTGKSRPPEPEQVAAAREQLRRQYQPELGKGGPEARTRLVKSLLDQAEPPADKGAAAGETPAAVRYALLELAAEIALEGGDPETALKTCDRLAGLFVVDVLALKERLLRFLVGRQLDQPVPYLEAVLATGFAALAADRYPVAGGLAQTAQAVLARKTGKQRLPEWDYQSAFLAEEVARVGPAYQRARPSLRTLRVNPDDPAASREVGVFLCLYKNDWDGGLGKLARGDDPALRQLAEQELKPPVRPDVRRQLGDAWWDAGERAGVDQLEYRRRAKYWYLKALAGTPTDERMALAPQLLPRIDSLPERPVVLRLSLRNFSGYHSFNFTNDGIAHWKSRNNGLIQINHLRWDGPIKGHKNTGAGRLYPDSIDFLTADVHDEWIHRWTGAQFRADLSGLNIVIHETPTNAVDAIVLITLQPNNFALANRMSGLWTVKFFAIPAEVKLTKSGPGPAEWEQIQRGPVLEERVADRIDFRACDQPPFANRWDSVSKKVPYDWFAMVATSEWELPEGRYRVRTLSDDGVRVFIGDRKVIDNWAVHGTTPDTALVQLPAGRHQIRVEYFQHNNTARLQFLIQRREAK